MEIYCFLLIPKNRKKEKKELYITDPKVCLAHEKYGLGLEQLDNPYKL